VPARCGAFVDERRVVAVTTRRQPACNPTSGDRSSTSVRVPGRVVRCGRFGAERWRAPRRLRAAAGSPAAIATHPFCCYVLFGTPTPWGHACRMILGQSERNEHG
jgi:hypothetical protein